jgi:hypothetical protein
MFSTRLLTLLVRLHVLQASVEDIETLVETQYPSVQATKSGTALKAVLKLFEHLVTYMEGLLAISPYVNGPFDSRTKGVAALSDLNQLANEPYMAYLKSKLGEWYSEPPRPASKQPAVDADEPAPAGPTLSLVEAMAAGLYSISKAFRPEFNAGGAQEVRSERQTGTAQCPGCRAPYLEADRHRKALITL